MNGSVEHLLIGLTLLQDAYIVFTMINLLDNPLEVVLDIPHVLRIVSGQGHLLTLTAAALRYSLTPQTPEDQTTGEQTV